MSVKDSENIPGTLHPIPTAVYSLARTFALVSRGRKAARLAWMNERSFGTPLRVEKSSFHGQGAVESVDTLVDSMLVVFRARSDDVGW